MTFKLVSDETDLLWLSQQLRDAEQAGGKLPPELRALLSQAAHVIDECRSTMHAAMEQLDLAGNYRIGMMDSQSKADEVWRRTRMVMAEQAGCFRSLLSQRTPHALPPAKQRTAEVI